MNQEDDADFDKDCPDNKQTHFYQFKEYDRTIELIKQLPTNVKELRDKEKSFEQFLFIIDSYQEQPHLIDPYLSEIFDKLILIVKECMNARESLIKENQNDDVKRKLDLNEDLINETFKYLYTFTKMRGYKKVVQYLPHEINDFEPILALLTRQDMRDVYKWQTRYMLLLWLSIICMVPFDLDRFDTKGEESIMNRMLNICIPYLFATDKCQDASAYVLAKFMSRLDLKSTVLPDFFGKLHNLLVEAKKENNNIKLLGTLKCLASIYKYGKREDLLKYTSPTLDVLISLELLSTSPLSVVRKFHTKLVQRIGMTFFKIKIAKWRYERGSRVLAENINLDKKDGSKSSQKKKDAEGEEEEMVPNEIEEIINQLLFGLKDRDTIVRWSSAKGIGRITNRLPKEMAGEVLESVLDLFTFVEDDSAWHGGCLSLAELGRRGLLLPQQLPLVIPIMLKALIFDKKLGNYSLGRNVRDSACYVCWALARAFEPHIMQPYVNQIASYLIIVTIFDREVNCRRAASAAFQENVGRQGQFPHGIDILTKCDYFAVGQIQNCYLNLSVFISQFGEYKKTLTDHLLEHKFNHWDQSVRELTSKALYNLTKTQPDYMATEVIPKLLEHSFSIDLNTRHGSLLSLGEVIDALCKEAISNSNSSEEKLGLLKRYFPLNILGELKKMISKIFDEKYFRGSGAEYMRPAVCFFIKKLALSRLFNQSSLFGDDKTYKLDSSFMKECEEFLNQTLEYNKESVQEAAVDTIPYYCDLRYEKSDENNSVNKDLVKESKLLQNYSERLIITSKEFFRSAYCLAIGNLPRYLLLSNGNFKKAIDILIESSKIRPNYENMLKHGESSAEHKLQPIDHAVSWVQARKDSIKGLGKLFDLIKFKQDFELFNLNESLLTIVFECFLNGLNDYTIDSKGDSGSKVREASINAIEFLIDLCAKHDFKPVVTNQKLISDIFAGIIQQAVERIDRTRNIAGNAFKNLLYNKNLKLDEFDLIKTIRQVFTKQQCSLIEWNVAHLTFPLFVKLISLKELRNRLLTGIMFSIGSLTESLVKSATMSFLKELQQLSKENKLVFKEIIKQILEITRAQIHSDRLAISIIKAVDLIVQNGLLNDDDLIKVEHIPAEFIAIFAENVRVTKDMQKLITYVDLFSDMVQFKEERVRERSMLQLMIMLCHQYPRIRKTAASKLFEALINYSDIIDNDEDTNECFSLLTDTDWDQPIDVIKPIRNKVCDLTKTPQPIAKKKV